MKYPRRKREFKFQVPHYLRMWLGGLAAHDWVMRSQYELDQANRLAENEIFFTYEAEQISYNAEVYNAVCNTCGGADCVSARLYTPDFYFPVTGIFAETKGRFDQPSRKKMKAVCTQSERDVRMVFMRDNYLTKKKSMSYTRWCELNGINAAVGDIPLEWGRR